MGARQALVAAVAVILVLLLLFFLGPRNAGGGHDKGSFWTQYGGAIPPDQQARRVDAAEKGVPDMAWAVAYWPPRYCRARPPPVLGEPSRI